MMRPKLIQSPTEQRRRNMQAVKCAGSKIEKMLCSELWKRGIRYRKNVKNIPGKPDIAFPGKRVAVFCDSEFWHGYDWGRRKNDIKTNRDFWITKIERNIQRDKEVTKKLEEDGWIVVRFWGKEILSDCKRCADDIEKIVRGE